MIKVPYELDRFPTERNRFLPSEYFIGDKTIGIVLLFEELGDTFRGNDPQPLDVLKCCCPSNMIFVGVRVDENSNRFVRNIRDSRRNPFSKTLGRVEDNDAFVSD